MSPSTETPCGVVVALYGSTSRPRGSLNHALSLFPGVRPLRPRNTPPASIDRPPRTAYVCAVMRSLDRKPLRVRSVAATEAKSKSNCHSISRIPVGTARSFRWEMELDLIVRPFQWRDLVNHAHAIERDVVPDSLVSERCAVTVTSVLPAKTEARAPAAGLMPVSLVFLILKRLAARLNECPAAILPKGRSRRAGSCDTSIMTVSPEGLFHRRKCVNPIVSSTRNIANHIRRFTNLGTLRRASSRLPVIHERNQIRTHAPIP
jgi:hypothetical protein